MRDDQPSLLIDRLAASIVDESLPLKDVEKELRGTVAEVAVKKRGLEKREIANRCGVTEKSIDNYLKEARTNPKSPEREVARLIQDAALTLEEVFEGVRPVLCHGRRFTLDDTKRALEKLIRTGEAVEVPGKKYRGSDRPSIRVPMTVDVFRDLVDEKARDLDYIILSQKEVTTADLPPKRPQQFARVVKDTSLIRIDFTVGIAEEEIPEFYEKLSAEIAKLTLKYEKKRGATRVRVLLGMRSAALLFAALAGLAALASGARADVPGMLGRTNDPRDSWELDNRAHGQPRLGPEGDGGAAADPDRDRDAPVDPADADRGNAGRDRRGYRPIFLRGDATLDGRIDVSDVLALTTHLTQAEDLLCADAADATDDGRIDLSDPILLIRFLFGDGVGIAAPLGQEGPDETPDGLGCAALDGSRG